MALPASQEPEVLVAGCGTGKHAIDVAGQYRGAKVTAIDISRASLGYARRMAKQENIGNIDFLAADIMSLGPWQRRFDLIESAGVLHHLSDPEAGWRILCGLLAPHGLMKVALYSALGRRDLRAARDFAAAGNGNVTPARIRRARAEILALPAADRRRRALQFSDFYSLRGCRDLLFNVQEREYDLTEIDAIMGRLGLDFIGFQFADINTQARFKAAYPDADLDDLSVWHAFELANQDTFSGMYQIWCRARGD
jgi:SAM-dependent methyltransferase